MRIAASNSNFGLERPSPLFCEFVEKNVTCFCQFFRIRRSHPFSKALTGSFSL
jgi:hypothetical protein